MDPSSAKQAAAARAVSYITDDMVVGLGTGSTANFAIEMIGARVRSGLKILGVPSSDSTERLARAQGVPLISEFTRIDLTIDGADEIDENGDMIKGGGGALTREKIVAAASKKEIIIIDESKLVATLGAFPLPVEVLPFGWTYVRDTIEALGSQAKLRKSAGEVFLTDNKNYILDCQFQQIDDPRKLCTNLNAIPGVVENGLFVGLTDRVIIGQTDGSFEEKLL